MELVDFPLGGHILDCDLVYDDLPCNCDGRPTAFWETNWERKYGQDKEQA